MLACVQVAHYNSTFGDDIMLSTKYFGNSFTINKHPSLLTQPAMALFLRKEMQAEGKEPSLIQFSTPSLIKSKVGSFRLKQTNHYINDRQI